MNIYLNDEKLYEEVCPILENFGLDAASVIKVLFKRIKDEKSIAFLFERKSQSASARFEEKQPNVERASETRTATASFAQRKLTKTTAISLFKHAGYDMYFSGSTTFSTGNTTTKKYWANPSFLVLETEWTIILNNTEKQELYLFHIPAGSIRKIDLVGRADKKDLIDLQIQYNDPMFTETRSKHMFGDYLITTITY